MVVNNDLVAKIVCSKLKASEIKIILYLTMRAENRTGNWTDYIKHQEIAKDIPDIKASTISNILPALKRKGWVDTERCSRNGNKYMVVTPRPTSNRFSRMVRARKK